MPKWIKITIVILGALAGFNVLSSFVGMGTLFIMNPIGNSNAGSSISIAMICGTIAGLVDAVACPLFVQKILKNKGKRVYIIAMLLLLFFALAPLPHPFIYTIM